MKNYFKKVIVFLLTHEADLILRKYKPNVIAITGSVGKTSTKDAVAAALARFMYVRKSPKSFNSEFGVPLTILGAKNPTTTTNIVEWLAVLVKGLDLLLLPHHYPEWLVLEVGTEQPGDIRDLTRWLKPDIVVVTHLAEVPVHVEQFANPEALFREKGYLVEALKSDGVLILNADDKEVMKYRDRTPAEVVTFNLPKENHYEIIYDARELPMGISCNVKNVSVKLLGRVGEVHMYPIVIALTVCEVLGEDLHAAAKAFENEQPTPGRLRLIDGIRDSIIIDDSYNSSPIAIEEALHTLKTIKKKRGKRKIAVLGDMLELGRYSLEEHKKAGARAAKSADLLVCVGVRARAIGDGAVEAGMREEKILEFNDSRIAGAALAPLVKNGDIVLVKGSQGVRMERIVLALMAHQEEKEKLLVRHDKEWQAR